MISSVRLLRAQVIIVMLLITLSFKKTKEGCVILTVYVDDILLTGSDTAGIAKTKHYLGSHFITKDMRRPRYFLRIEFVH